MRNKKKVASIEGCQMDLLACGSENIACTAQQYALQRVGLWEPDMGAAQAWWLINGLKRGFFTTAMNDRIQAAKASR